MKKWKKRETIEAKIFKAIDGMEAVLQHNISDISTWLPNEYGTGRWGTGNDKNVYS